MYGRQELQVGLTDGVVAAAQGRNAVGELVAHAPATFVFDAMLATSELVTNALVHGSGRIDLSARFDRERGWLRVEVSDSSPQLPRVAEAQPDRIGGLGLQIVAELSTTWGAYPNDRGKTVWFELMQWAARDGAS